MHPEVNNNNAAIRDTRKTESIRSSKPPWPGINVPESLTPLLRFIRLSTRSPITPATPQIRPYKIHCHSSMLTPGKINSKSQSADEHTRAGKNPSHVFLGLI